MKPDSEKTYMEQGKDMLAGKADVSLPFPPQHSPYSVRRPI